ncbi:hypothetical protein [Crocosphaera sp.]|uniref:hypothetical protein n=1 Tax=Crocosphaera sp. TaxID=2729996 RepID=UPI00260A765B|nr:hypothetical protein [Crocosphaera sp.]MDJ0583280.1 hypothetical protein [Crocosphaera sp.]
MIKILDTMKYAALAILKKVAVKIIKFRLLGKGETPWVYYEDKQGKRRATFLKKSEFNGYDWNDDYSEVTNLETGEVYQVSADSCTCKDWYYRVRTGQKAQCKHQMMRSEYVEVEPSQNLNDFDINDEDLPPGCFTRKHETENNIEYRLFAWVKKFNGEEYYPETEEIGSIIKTQFSGVEAWFKKAIHGVPFDAVDDAVNYLLRKINLTETAQVYQYAESIF